jgi:hypothetical protein
MDLNTTRSRMALLAALGFIQKTPAGWKVAGWR